MDSSSLRYKGKKSPAKSPDLVKNAPSQSTSLPTQSTGGNSSSPDPHEHRVPLLSTHGKGSTPQLATKCLGNSPRSHDLEECSFTKHTPQSMDSRTRLSVRGKTWPPDSSDQAEVITPRRNIQRNVGTPRTPSHVEERNVKSPTPSRICTSKPSAAGECNTQRFLTRTERDTLGQPMTGKLGTQQNYASEAIGLDEKRNSFATGTQEVCLVEINSPVPPCPKDVCALVLQGPMEVGASAASTLRGLNYSVVSIPDEVTALEFPCPVEVGAQSPSYPGRVAAAPVPCLNEEHVLYQGKPAGEGDLCSSLTPYQGEVGTSKTSAKSEVSASLSPAKAGSLKTLGEGAASVGPNLGEGGVMSASPVFGEGSHSEVTFQGRDAASGSGHLMALEQNVPIPGDKSDLSSIEIFNTTVETFLENLVEAGGYERFAKCYECFYKFQPEMTRGIYDQFISELQTSFKDEIREIKEEGNLEALLESLDKIKDEAKSRVEPAWRSSGIPEEDLRNALVPYYLKHKEYMRKLLKEKESENAKLAESVLAGRQHIASLQEQIQKRKDDWTAISKAQRELLRSLGEPTPEKLRWDH